VSLNDPIDEAIAAVPERSAFIDGETVITYRNVGTAIDRAAAALAARGVSRGDRVALAESTGLAAVATILGCARIGAAGAPMSPALTAGEMKALIAAAGCGPIGVAGAAASASLAEALGTTPLRGRDLDAEAPAHRHAQPGEDAAALVLFTGGTTGTPKPIVLSHGVLERRVRGFAPPVDPAGAPAIALICVPFHHVAGLVGVLVGLAGGGTAVIQRRFEAGAWLELVQRHRVQRVFLVPTMLHRILEHPRFAGADVSSLQLITYGAAPASAELIDRAVKELPGAMFVNVFGQTETLGAVTALGPEDHAAGRAGSVGKPMPGVEVRIVDVATGADVAEGETGEFWVRADHTYTDGWVRTGDLVRRDADGYLHAMGRLSDVINRGGEKIDPGEVEDALRAHPAVVDAAVCGVLDAEMGERVGAVVVGDADAEALKAWCRERLAAYKVPERFRFVDEIPLTELGKVSRKDLRALLA
jgi:long-chain acyl-CoA synthetase